MKRLTILLKHGLLALLMAAPLAALAQAWPSKPVKIILTSGPGTPPDVLIRGVGAALQERTGQPFIIENRPGANTIIGMQACAAAAADGYTFCFTTNDSVSVNPHLFSKLPYDPDKSFTPVAILAWPNSVVVVGSQVGAKTFADVVALSKAKPGTLNWGSFGTGSSSHLYLEWIRSRTGWDVTHVPYNAGGAVPAALAGQVQLTYLSIGALKPHIDSGKFVPIAVAGLQRSPFLPDVPTFSEVGLGDFFVRTWFGLFAPAGTPASIVSEMNRLSVAVVNDPAYRAKTMDVLTLSPGHESPAEMQAYLKKDREAGGELVRIAKVKLD
jgi:tripartite-type tricarboxylate transporter receptor subunit TctC